MADINSRLYAYLTTADLGVYASTDLTSMIQKWLDAHPGDRTAKFKELIALAEAA